MIKDWKKEFDKKFPHLYMEVYDNNVDDEVLKEKEQKVKQFIQDLLLQQQEEMVKDTNYWFDELLTLPLGDYERERIEKTKENLLTTLKSKDKG